MQWLSSKVVNLCILCHVIVVLASSDSSVRPAGSFVDNQQSRSGGRNLHQAPYVVILDNAAIISAVLPVVARLPKGKNIIVVAKNSGMNGDIKCDGEKDEIEITAAIKAAGPGNKVILSDGTFVIEENLYLKDGVTIEGQGMDRTIIMLAKMAPKWNEAGFFRGFKNKDVIIRSLTIDGNRQNNLKKPENVPGRFGFYCEACFNVLMEYVKSKSHTGYGIDPHGIPRGDQFSDGFIIRHSIVTDNGFDGITIDKTKNAIIQNNTVTKNGRHGINIVTGSKNVLITGNRVYDNGHFYYKEGDGCGINVVDQINHAVFFGTTNVTVIRNDIRGSKRDPVCVNNADDIRVISNTLNSGKVKECMDFKDANKAHVEGNNCFGDRIMVRGKYDKGSYKFVSQGPVTFR